jgi:hypothetical protein
MYQCHWNILFFLLVVFTHACILHGVNIYNRTPAHQYTLIKVVCRQKFMSAEANRFGCACRWWTEPKEVDGGWKAVWNNAMWQRLHYMHGRPKVKKTKMLWPARRTAVSYGWRLDILLTHKLALLFIYIYTPLRLLPCQWTSLPVGPPSVWAQVDRPRWTDKHLTVTSVGIVAPDTNGNVPVFSFLSDFTEKRLKSLSSRRIVQNAQIQTQINTDTHTLPVGLGTARWGMKLELYHLAQYFLRGWTIYIVYIN